MFKTARGNPPSSRSARTSSSSSTRTSSKLRTALPLPWFARSLTQTLALLLPLVDQQPCKPACPHNTPNLPINRNVGATTLAASACGLEKIPVVTGSVCPTLGVVRETFGYTRCYQAQLSALSFVPTYSDSYGARQLQVCLYLPAQGTTQRGSQDKREGSRTMEGALVPDSHALKSLPAPTSQSFITAFTNPLLRRLSSSPSSFQTRTTHDIPQTTNNMSSGQIAAPYAIKPSQRANIRLSTSQDLYTTLSSSLSPLKGHQRPAIPFDNAMTKEVDRSPTSGPRILEDDYAVPAPPPPSPVSFRADRWPTPACH
ncbi:hypothetical protein CCMA1212_002144 [Trichoderma ghanense]|uniref:Uncharacterized protein n=1 Tax=Trichoderma ghanense TaxID=65468 RepID=A0ABY2HE23_9HYPO